MECERLALDCNFTLVYQDICDPESVERRRVREERHKIELDKGKVIVSAILDRK